MIPEARLFAPKLLFPAWRLAGYLVARAGASSRFAGRPQGRERHADHVPRAELLARHPLRSRLLAPAGVAALSQTPGRHRGLARPAAGRALARPRLRLRPADAG